MTTPHLFVPHVAADILARLHYGLPLEPSHLKGNATKGYRSCLSRLRSIGHIAGNRVTRQGYLYLREAIRKRQLEKQHGN